MHILTPQFLTPAGQLPAAAEQHSTPHQADAKPAHQLQRATTMEQVASASAEQCWALPGQQHAACGRNPKSAVHLRQLPGRSALGSLPHSPFLDLQHQCPPCPVPLTAASMTDLSCLAPAASDDWVQQALTAAAPSFDFPGAIISGLSQDTAPDLEPSALAADPALCGPPSALLTSGHQEMVPSPQLQPSALAADPAWCDFTSALLDGSSCHAAPAKTILDDWPAAPIGEVSQESAFPLQPAELEPGCHTGNVADMLSFSLSGLSSLDPDPALDECNGLPTSAPINTLAADQLGQVACYRGVPQSESAEPGAVGGSRPEEPSIHSIGAMAAWGNSPALAATGLLANGPATLPCYQDAPSSQNALNPASPEMLALDHMGEPLPCYRGVPVARNGIHSAMGHVQHGRPCLHPEAALPCWSVMDDQGLQDAWQFSGASDERAHGGSDNSEQMSARQATTGLTTSIWDGAHMPLGNAEVLGTDAGLEAVPWYEQLPAVVGDNHVNDLVKEKVTVSTAGWQPAHTSGSNLRHAQEPRHVVTNLDMAPSPGGQLWGEDEVGMGPGAMISRPVTCQQEDRLGYLLQSLAQPAQNGQHCPLGKRMPVLQEINALRGAATRSPCLRALYRRNMQVTIFPTNQANLAQSVYPATGCGRRRLPQQALDESGWVSKELLW